MDAVQRAADPELDHREIPTHLAPWRTLLVLALLIGSVTWLAFHGPEPVSIPRSDPPPAPPVSSQGTVTAPAAVHPPAAPAPEVKQAIPNATPDAVVAMRARAADEHLATLAEKMVKGLENAVTHSDRLRWIDATEQEQADIKRFFEARHGRFGSAQLEPSVGKVTLLPSGEEIKLFRLTTATCPEGAILQVREDGGRAKMRWGLFEQSHEKTYDRFLAAADNGKGTAQWFALLCQRGHSFELKGQTETHWICLDAQGSLGAGGTGQIYVNKDSAAGRFLGPKTQWGRLYLVDLLIGRMDIEARRLNVVLDCAGLHGGTGRH